MPARWRSEPIKSRLIGNCPIREREHRLENPSEFSWSPNYHILLHESIIEIVSNIQNISPPSTPPSTPSTPGGATSNSISPLRIELLTFDCKHINVDLFLNQNKQIEIKMLNTKYIWSRKNWQADVDSVKFFFDQQIRNDDRPLIDITGQSILYSLGCKQFRELFRNFDLCMVHPIVVSLTKKMITTEHLYMKTSQIIFQQNQIECLLSNSKVLFFIFHSTIISIQLLTWQ